MFRDKYKLPTTFQILFSELMRNQPIQLFNYANIEKLPNSVNLIALSYSLTRVRTNSFSQFNVFDNWSCVVTWFMSPDRNFWNHRWRFFRLRWHHQRLCWYSCCLCYFVVQFEFKGKIYECELCACCAYTLKLLGEIITTPYWHSGIFKL